MKPIIKARVQRLADELLDGPALLDFDPEGYVTATRYSAHEEGYSRYDAQIVPLADGSFRVDSCSSGRDCDGYLSREDVRIARPRRKARRFYMGYPKRGRIYARRYGWRSVSASVYDESAVNAGY